MFTVLPSTPYFWGGFLLRGVSFILYSVGKYKYIFEIWVKPDASCIKIEVNQNFFVSSDYSVLGRL